MESAPAPPEIVSSPMPPSRVSLPAPPDRVSLPSKPSNQSSPLPPTKVSLPRELQGLNGAAASSLKFGVRPEDITLAPAVADAAALPAELLLLEPLGAETLATLKIGATEMVARCPASFRERPGHRLQVHVNPRQLHLFDAASGRALRA